MCFLEIPQKTIDGDKERLGEMIGSDVQSEKWHKKEDELNINAKVM